MLLALAGCGTLQVKEFDRNANQGIRKIALLDVDELTQFQLISQSGILVIPLPTGPVVDSGIRVDQTTLTRYYADHKQLLGRELTNALETELLARGYQVVHIHADRERTSEFLGNYKLITTDADAILMLLSTMAAIPRTEAAYSLPTYIRRRASSNYLEGKSSIQIMP